MKIMPTYEYKCDKCGGVFEQFQSITAKPLRKGPVCKTSNLKRLIGSGAVIIFKGSGFYQTDYRTENYKKAQKSEKETAPTGEKKKEAGSAKKAETAAK
jgi:putative FmdB family regulatory protein